ncbi:MAG: UDP-glucose/GDP-mannose dehydrogenase family protein [Verrucomicrobia bacterium]|nr:UDP-glucose/GDP-mannose dehydrogenase family protein [Verrucomicrobiota bacterium]
MKVVVLGLWHLGCVTAACCAKFFDVIGLDLDQHTVDQLKAGIPPVFEPELAELIQEGFASHRLLFACDPAIALAGADLLWVTYDTPVDDDDNPDVNPILEGIERCVSFLPDDALVLISSQVPAGTCAMLEGRYPSKRFVYSPENLRLGKAIDTFLHQDRIVLGARRVDDFARVSDLLSNFSSTFQHVSTGSAEMIKHGINSFLALSITFMNEIARICEHVGADAWEVERGLKSEPRIGPKAYLSPGGPFAGGTLARDVVTLNRLAAQAGEELILISAIKNSNDQHKKWSIQKLREEFGSVAGRRVAILGLTYKPNTDTLRRSLAIELCRSLIEEQATLKTYDPVVATMPADLAHIPITRSLPEAVRGADATVIATEWPQLLKADWQEAVQLMNQPIIVDANGFLRSKLSEFPGVRYRSVGSPRNYET